MGSAEHAVIVTYSLSGGAFGEPREHDSVRALQQRLTTAIESADVGEFAGNEFGGGKVSSIESIFNCRFPGHALNRPLLNR